jgi:hypothetical protein
MIAVHPAASHAPAAALELAPLADATTPKPVHASRATHTSIVEPPERSVDIDLPQGGSSMGRRVAVAAVILLLVVAGGFAGARFLGGSGGEATTGTLTITTNPTGAQAIIDGEPRGITPLTVALAPGSHVVELRGGGEPRTIPVTIAAGAETTQYIELPKGAPVVGQLHVRSEPAGAQVIVDGTPRGAAPTLVTDLAPGEHIVVLQSELGSVKQSVTIEAGVTSSLVVPLTASDGAPISGWWKCRFSRAGKCSGRA